MRLYKLVKCTETSDVYEEAGIKDVIEWFNEIYPAAIFTTHPIAQVRDMLNAILRGDIPKSGTIPKER